MNYKLIFCDLDDTLIKTKSGETFPQGIWDMELNLLAIDALKKLAPEAIAIVSNQGGIELGHVNSTHFQAKLEYIQFSIKELTGIPTLGLFCPTNNKEDKYRKPHTGMLDTVFSMFEYSKEDCCMVGDASGLPGQFSDSDKKTAENFGIDYFDINEFIDLVNKPNQPCPEIPFFCTCYPDARCINGYLYDLDNCDEDGNLYYPSETVPCPFCNKREFIESYGWDEYNKIIEWVKKNYPDYKF